MISEAGDLLEVLRSEISVYKASVDVILVPGAFYVCMEFFGRNKDIESGMCTVGRKYISKCV